MYEQILTNAGLSKEQASVYQLLMQGGLTPAGVISKKTALKRGLTYKVLEQLINQGLVQKRDDLGKITLFQASHPGVLRKLTETKAEEVKNAQVSLESVMGKMVSDYNLVTGKPNVQFFEGLDGVRRVLDDSLSATGEIYSYADIESIEKYIHDVNEKYVEKRDKFNVKKKAILLDTPFARDFLKDYHKQTTDIRLIKQDSSPFHSVMQIYDNKISYITLSDKEMIGVIIEDPHIFEMHKYLFEYSWDKAESLLVPEVSKY